MSCPNPDLLSAFFDGELESPWSERIKEHVESCGPCRQALERLKKLRRVLLTDEEPPLEGSLQRMRERLHVGYASRLWHRRAIIWRRRVSVPVPALAAMLTLFLGMGALLIFLSTRPNFPFMSIKTQPSGITEVQVAAPIEDLEQLLRSLDQEPGNQQILITLPEDTQFLHLGEPRMFRADELGRRLR
jgi:hypothetical protein